MTTIKISEAPFTEEEKQQITAMGISEADWGHPDIVLEDPVAFFTEQVDIIDDFPEGPGLGEGKSNEQPPPFTT